MYFLNSSQCVKCWTLSGLLSTGGLRSKKSTRFSIIFTSCCCTDELRSAAYQGLKAQRVSGNPSLLRKLVLPSENFVTMRWICSVTSCIVFKQTTAFSSLLESFSCYLYLKTAGLSYRSILPQLQGSAGVHLSSYAYGSTTLSYTNISLPLPSKRTFIDIKEAWRTVVSGKKHTELWNCVMLNPFYLFRAGSTLV